MSDLLTRLWDEGGRRIPEGQAGRLKVEKVRVTAEEEAQYARIAALAGETRYDRAGEYTTLTVDGEVWMSNTPDEREDHRECFEQAQRLGGRCLVHGLGLGLIVHALLALPNVEHVDVVEFDRDVIRLVEMAFVGDIAAGRLTVHVEDCLLKVWPEDARWQVVWHDIWLPLTEANLAEMELLHDMFRDRCVWQGSWGFERLLEQRARRLAGAVPGVKAEYSPG